MVGKKMASALSGLMFPRVPGFVPDRRELALKPVEIHPHISKVRRCCLDAINSNPAVYNGALEDLGVDANDKSSKITMRGKLIEVMSPDVVFLPSPADPGIFFVFKLKGKDEDEKLEMLERCKNALKDSIQKAVSEDPTVEPIAVFKMGAKRALLELSLRKIAFLLGFSDHVIEGVFYAAENLDINSWNATDVLEEDLWSGASKVYNRIQRKSYSLMGILEPFLKNKGSSNLVKKDLFANITILSMAAGIRDVQVDNIANGKLFDAEEIMPNRIEPPEDVEEACSATHLPFLESALKDESINARTFKTIKEKVMSWRPEEISKKVGELKVIYADEPCEFSSDSKIDQGGCSVLVEDDELSSEMFGAASGMVTKELLYIPNVLTKGEETPIFNELQLKAFVTRLSRIQGIFRKNKSLTPYQIVKAVDRFFVEHVKLEQAILRKDEIRALSAYFSNPDDPQLMDDSSQGPAEKGGSNTHSFGNVVVLTEKKGGASSSPFKYKERPLSNHKRTVSSTAEQRVYKDIKRETSSKNEAEEIVSAGLERSISWPNRSSAGAPSSGGLERSISLPKGSGGIQTASPHNRGSAGRNSTFMQVGRTPAPVVMLGSPGPRTPAGLDPIPFFGVGSIPAQLHTPLPLNSGQQGSPEKQRKGTILGVGDLYHKVYEKRLEVNKRTYSPTQQSDDEEDSYFETRSAKDRTEESDNVQSSEEEEKERAEMSTSKEESEVSSPSESSSSPSESSSSESSDDD